MCAVSIEQLIDRRIDKWRKVELTRHDEVSTPHRPVITISREYGAGGKELAEMLAERMKIVVFDKEIIDNMAKQAHINAKMVAMLDEQHRSAMESWVDGILTTRLFDRTDYMHYLLKAMKTMAMRGGCIILGRGGNFVLRNEPGVCHFRIVAEEPQRVMRIAAREHLPIEEAKQVVRTTSRMRRKFLKDTYPKNSVDDPTGYHMIFNSGRIGLEAIAGIIQQVVESSERQRLEK